MSGVSGTETSIVFALLDDCLTGFRHDCTLPAATQELPLPACPHQPFLIVALRVETERWLLGLWFFSLMTDAATSLLMGVCIIRRGVYVCGWEGHRERERESLPKFLATISWAVYLFFIEF